MKITSKDINSKISELADLPIDEKISLLIKFIDEKYGELSTDMCEKLLSKSSKLFSLIQHYSDISSNDNTLVSGNLYHILDAYDYLRGEQEYIELGVNIDDDMIDDIDLDELKTLIEQYAVGIERIDYQYENLESNTILLFIAKRFFDTNSSKSSLDIDTKYASTASNFHKYLTELTGKKYKDIEYINSYTNYIGYSKTNKAYVLGKDSSIITNENYVCTAIEVVDKENDLYTARAIIRRTANDVKTVYQITFNFKLNKDYEYQKYHITALNAINSSFYPDNTVHLVAN